LTNGNLNINDLSKIEDKCSFFNWKWYLYIKY
jgi:hypothetical protein